MNNPPVPAGVLPVCRALIRRRGPRAPAGRPPRDAGTRATVRLGASPPGMPDRHRADVTKRFGGFTALNGVSFEVAEGEILGLIGPNGSGKTTMFNCISGALPPTPGPSGSGRGDRGLTPDAICHRGLARTFQIPRPFRKLSILENVAVAAHFGAAPEHGGGRGARARDPDAGRTARRRRRVAHAARRGRAQEARAGASARHRARSSCSPTRAWAASTRRDGGRRRDAAADPRRARGHHRVGRAHHGHPDARGRPRGRARPRREDRRGPAARGGRGPAVIEAYLGEKIVLATEPCSEASGAPRRHGRLRRLHRALGRQPPVQAGRGGGRGRARTAPARPRSCA